MTRLATLLGAATREGLLIKKPAEMIELPKRSRKEIAPFTLAEANNIIDRLYQHEHWPSLIYAPLFEVIFFTGLRLSEALAVRGMQPIWERRRYTSRGPLRWARWRKGQKPAETSSCTRIRRHTEKRRDRNITDAEFERICDKASPNMRVIYEMYYLTGQRISDMLSIHLSDISEEGIALKQQKTGARLIVWMSQT